jgi:hypothetical protein
LYIHDFAIDDVLSGELINTVCRMDRDSHHKSDPVPSQVTTTTIDSGSSGVAGGVERFDDSDSDSPARRVVSVPDSDLRVGLSRDELTRKRKADRERRKQEALKRGILKRKQQHQQQATTTMTGTATGAIHQKQLLQQQSAAIAAAVAAGHPTIHDPEHAAAIRAANTAALHASASVQRALSSKRVRKLLAPDGSVQHITGVPNGGALSSAGNSPTHHTQQQLHNTKHSALATTTTNTAGRTAHPQQTSAGARSGTRTGTKTLHRNRTNGSEDDDEDDNDADDARAPHVPIPSFELSVDDKIRSLDQSGRIRMLYACAFAVAVCPSEIFWPVHTFILFITSGAGGDVLCSLVGGYSIDSCIGDCTVHIICVTEIALQRVCGRPVLVVCRNVGLFGSESCQ